VEHEPKTGKMLCMLCLRIAELATGRIISHSTRQKTAKESKEEVNLLTAQHIKKWKLVELWVIATTTTCQYVLLRIIMWCREGRLVGMLPSNDSVWRRNHHNTEPQWIVNVGVLVTHLLSLYKGGHGPQWPRGKAPIILAATSDQYLKSLKQQLTEQGFPPDECARLRGVPFTLSAQRAKKDLVLEELLQGRAAQSVRMDNQKAPVVRGRKCIILLILLNMYWYRNCI